MNYTEPNNLGDLLKFEAPSLYSREEVEVLDKQNLVMGALVGRDSKTNIFKAWSRSANDGTQTPVGVLIQEINTKAVIIARHAILADHAIVWPVNTTVEQKASAIKQLEIRGIVIRKGV